MDSYVISDRVFIGDPHNPPDLGEGALTGKVGWVQLPPPPCDLIATTLPGPGQRYKLCVFVTFMPINQRQASHNGQVDHFDSLDPGPRLSGPHRGNVYRHYDCDTGQGVT